MQLLSAHETQHAPETLHCMSTRDPEITMDEDLRQAALKPILRMLEMS